MLKNSIIYSFIFLISIATCSDSMAYILKSYGDSSYTWVNTISAEEKGDEEPGGCIKKSESPDAFEHLFLHNAFTSAYTQVDNFYSKRENQFPSSDFSEEVFFPPEVI